jgi:hypothetical protein
VSGVNLRMAGPFAKVGVCGVSFMIEAVGFVGDYGLDGGP